jgi:hypothetical protein
MHGYFNLTESQREKFIYRIIPIGRFNQILKSKTFPFVNLDLWDDPYENFLLNQKFRTASGTYKSFKEITRIFYGSCWTFNNNSDYSWRVYAPKKDGIQVKARISKIKEHFLYLTNDKHCGSFQIGKVEYTRWKKLKEKYENKKKLGIFEILMNQTAFEKRFEYRHEKEIRLLIRYLDQDSQILELKIDPNFLFENVIVDPRISYNRFLKIKTEIKELGYKGRIYRSLLYTAPKINLQFDNIYDDQDS